MAWHLGYGSWCDNQTPHLILLSGQPQLPYHRGAQHWVGANSRNCQQALGPGTLDTWLTDLFLAGYQDQEGLQDWQSHGSRFYTAASNWGR